MRVLEAGEKDRTVRMVKEHDGKESLCGWVESIHCEYFCEACLINEYTEESKKCFPDGMTYQEAKDYLEGK
jgi:hypothetical protein